MSARSIRRARERRLERGGRGRRGVARRSKVAAGAGAALGATVLFTAGAEAATFTVSNLDDSGAGSLRDAVEQANANGEDDVITFQAALSGTIELAGADRDIEITGEGLELRGPGADEVTVDANEGGRIFTLYGFDAPGEEVSISDLTLTGGLYAGGSGGAINSVEAFNGIDANAAELTIADAVITGNSAQFAGGGVNVRGGSLTIADSLVAENGTAYSGGGVEVADTEGDRPTEVVVRNSSVTGNASGSVGGGLSIEGASAATVIERSTISGNSTGTGGGGIYIDDDLGGEAPVTIDRSTISGNSAAGNPLTPPSPQGGGIHVHGPSAAVTIQNTTISGNSTSGQGGGIAADSDAGTGGDELVVRNSTVAHNAAGEVGGGIYRDSYLAGYSLYGSDDVRISSTIVAGNSAPSGADLGEAPEINTGDGAFVLGFSLVESEEDVPAALTEDPAGSNLIGAGPGIGPLADNGGPTATHLPAPRSLAVDRGIADGLATDQRGLARTADFSAPNPPGGDGTDIGSVEVQSADCQGKGALKIDGTEGDDKLEGTGAPDWIFGLGGNDVLKGLGAADCLTGDEGKDKLQGGGGKDELSGGPGNDKLNGQAGKDSLRGDDGNDNVNGGAGKDRVRGGPGRDRVRGGPGKDRLNGGPGNDKLLAKDRKKDRINCGPGRDKAIVSENDRVSPSCEKVVIKD